MLEALRATADDGGGSQFVTKENLREMYGVINAYHTVFIVCDFGLKFDAV